MFPSHDLQAVFYRAGSLLHIFQNTDGTSEAMRIDSSGRLLHNTTSTGTANIIIDSQLGNGSALRLIGKSANDGSEIDFYADNNSTRLGYLEFNNTVTKLVSETSVPLSFFTNGSERMRILSSGGLTFNGDTATANALDDYEEGSWTPTVIGTSTVGTVTYAARIGDYTKVGNMVTVLLEVGWSGGTGSGFLAITGLPFTTTRNNVGAIGASSSLTFTSGQIPYVFTSTSATLYVGVSTPSSGANQLAYDTAASLYVTFSYMLV